MKKKNIIVAYLLEEELAQKMAVVPKELIPIRNAMLDAGKALEDSLTDKQKVLLEIYYNSTIEYRNAQEQYHFSEGFKAGMLFSKEINKKA